MKYVVIILLFSATCLANNKSEMKQLVERALKAQQMITININAIEKGAPADKEQDPAFWSNEYDKVKKTLLEKGFFIKVEATIPSEKFKEFFFKMVVNKEEAKLLFYTSSPYKPNQKQQNIYIIGPPKIVNKALANLKKITEIP